VEQLALGGRPLQVMVGLGMGGILMWNVIVVEADEPAVTVMLLGLAERVTVNSPSALAGFIRPATDSKIKPTENSKAQSRRKNVTDQRSPFKHLRLAI